MRLTSLCGKKKEPHAEPVEARTTLVQVSCRTKHGLECDCPAAAPPSETDAAMRRTSLLILLALLLPFGSALAEPIELRAVSVSLSPRDRDVTRAGALEFLAGFALASSDPRWGGFSSVLLDEASDRLIAVSDFGDWLRLDLRHDAAGRLTGVGAAEIGFLPGPDGQALDRKGDADAEALAVGPDGGLLVAFERAPRLWRYDNVEPLFGARPRTHSIPKAMIVLPSNGGVEALATLANGDLVALAEGPDGSAPESPGWLQSGGKWHPIAWRRTLPYRATDAATLPDGDLLVLERRYSFASGPGARLSFVAAEDIRPGARLTGVALAELAPPQTVDNFEGVTARAAPDGGVLIYLLSDDNRNLLQRTLLLQFRWTPPQPG